MDKKEKYINFIVDDLVKNTEIDYVNGYVRAPFLYPPSMNFHKKFYFNLYSHPSFMPHIKEKYGARNAEVLTIWGEYKERIKTLINNG